MQGVDESESERVSLLVSRLVIAGQQEAVAPLLDLSKRLTRIQIVINRTETAMRIDFRENYLNDPHSSWPQSGA